MNFSRTGMTRAQLTAYGDLLLDAAWRHASPSGSLITPPGRSGAFGPAVDGLEGFARTFLAAGFRLAGERGADPHHLAERYAAGLTAGVDPDHAERWVTPVEHPQAKVEAASIALILDMTRPWIWDRLTPRTQEQLVAYLSTVVGDDTYPHCNWVWFRIVTETFLRSVGGPWSADDIESDLAAHDSFVRDGGWYSDGDERAYDHYTGWALHLYPILWSRMSSAVEATGRYAQDVAHLDRYLRDAVRMVGADGAPLIQGRSLTYRFAAAAPFWAGVIAGVPGVPYGELRQAATRIVGHFVDHGVPGEDGLLTLGWYDEWRTIAQRYSGTGSPYWAAKGLLGLALPADHPVWKAPAEPLPIDLADQLDVFPAPGWALSATRDDGLVRVINHGTDHAKPGDRTADSPLYARLGYSTATWPGLDTDAWERPSDQSVVLLDAEGRATHRSGFRTLRTDLVENPDVAVLASVADAHWVDVDHDAPDHGSGRPGTPTAAGTITTVSAVRGAWEVRLVRLDDLVTDSDGRPLARSLEISGWAVPERDGPVSRVVPLADDPRSPMRATGGAIPCVRVAVDDASTVVGRWTVVAVGLAGASPGLARVPSADLPPTFDDGAAVVVTWPDGGRTAVELPYHSKESSS